MEKVLRTAFNLTEITILKKGEMGGGGGTPKLIKGTAFVRIESPNLFQSQTRF